MADEASMSGDDDEEQFQVSSFGLFWMRFLFHRFRIDS